MQTFDKITVKPKFVGKAIDTTIQKRSLCLKKFYRLFKAYREDMPAPEKENLNLSMDKNEKMFYSTGKRLKHLESLFIKVSSNS